MKIKVKDIAKIAGVSPATVSLVLNDKPSRIAESTKEHIKNIARELEFRITHEVDINQVKTKVIGLIIPDNTNQYYSWLENGVATYMDQQGYSVFTCNCMENTEKCFRQIEDLSIKDVEGIIVIPPASLSEKDIVKLKGYFDKSLIPMMLLDQAVYSLFTHFVTGDNKQGSYLATKHLLELGHTQIGLLGGIESTYITRKRTEGYKRALAEYHIGYDEQLVIHGTDIKQLRDEGSEHLIKLGCTAIVAASDQVAVAVYQKAEKLGIKIPDDLSVVGYNNTSLCEMLKVKLTSIDQNADLIGAKAAEVLLGSIRGENEEDMGPQNYYFSPVLVERESTRRR